MGQDQDILGGGFENDQSFAGEVSLFTIWNVALEIDNLYENNTSQLIVDPGE